VFEDGVEENSREQQVRGEPVPESDCSERLVFQAPQNSMIPDSNKWLTIERGPQENSRASWQTKGALAQQQSLRLSSSKDKTLSSAAEHGNELNTVDLALCFDGKTEELRLRFSTKSGAGKKMSFGELLLQGKTTNAILFCGSGFSADCLNTELEKVGTAAPLLGILNSKLGDPPFTELSLAADEFIAVHRGSWRVHTFQIAIRTVSNPGNSR
jgi:hypothetical protein